MDRHDREYRGGGQDMLRTEADQSTVRTGKHPGYPADHPGGGVILPPGQQHQPRRKDPSFYEGPVPRTGTKEAVRRAGAGINQAIELVAVRVEHDKGSSMEGIEQLAGDLRVELENRPFGGIGNRPLDGMTFRLGLTCQARPT